MLMSSAKIHNLQLFFRFGWCMGGVACTVRAPCILYGIVCSPDPQCLNHSCPGLSLGCLCTTTAPLGSPCDFQVQVPSLTPTTNPTHNAMALTQAPERGLRLQRRRGRKDQPARGSNEHRGHSGESRRVRGPAPCSRTLANSVGTLPPPPPREMGGGVRHRGSRFRQHDIKPQRWTLSRTAHHKDVLERACGPTWGLAHLLQKWQGANRVVQSPRLWLPQIRDPSSLPKGTRTSCSPLVPHLNATQSSCPVRLHICPFWPSAFCRRMTQGKGVSAVPPKTYGDRFAAFMEDHIC